MRCSGATRLWEEPGLDADRLPVEQRKQFWQTALASCKSFDKYFLTAQESLKVTGFASLLSKWAADAAHCDYTNIGGKSCLEPGKLQNRRASAR